MASIVAVFESCFRVRYRTVCVGGASEPLYVPASGATPAQLYFRGDFAASALHEISHWCLAGAGRRALPDFGYGYVPAPRSASAQVQFLRFEVVPQALERVFAEAAGVPFHYSFDDVDDRFVSLRCGFRNAVDTVHQQLLLQGALGALASPRAQCFRQALATCR